MKKCWDLVIKVESAEFHKSIAWAAATAQYGCIGLRRRGKDQMECDWALANKAGPIAPHLPLATVGLNVSCKANGFTVQFYGLSEWHNPIKKL